ncbi:hypothetical protein SUGI_0732160 [Cryptomeria japonica]|nr:hypothetical protein SUGI_0732160 [Cryptomeria japonica]
MPILKGRPPALEPTGGGEVDYWSRRRGLTFFKQLHINVGEDAEQKEETGQKAAITDRGKIFVLGIFGKRDGGTERQVKRDILICLKLKALRQCTFRDKQFKQIVQAHKPLTATSST